MLCQLSYSRALGRANLTEVPSFDQSHRSDLNRRPLDYESSALPLSYGGIPSCNFFEWRRGESNP